MRVTSGVSDSGFKDYFSSAAADYAMYRPRYPRALFDFVASLAPKHRAAWDCATGNGQAAVPLADRFERVFATDASAEQIAHAVPHPRVRYSVAMADASGLEAGVVDLVAVAQALHWLPHDRFFAEVRRVVAPGGVLAVWCYSRLRIDAAVDPVVERYYTETCGPYWSPERALVDQGYRPIALPIDEVRAPIVSMELAMNLDELAGYLRTWSATRALAAAIGRDPVVEVREELRFRWGDPEARRVVRWPLHVRAGRVVGA
ncbi:MAG: Methyltransferase type 11 protein [Geminicoccaceae bacterium]|nr:Methyltransferase type 11 protein [Geminicoccaceae bacterium]